MICLAESAAQQKRLARKSQLDSQDIAAKILV
jgi:hypothetical protein